jgi:hypothetical protein
VLLPFIYTSFPEIRIKLRSGDYTGPEKKCAFFGFQTMTSTLALSRSTNQEALSFPKENPGNVSDCYEMGSQLGR